MAKATGYAGKLTSIKPPSTAFSSALEFCST